MSNGAGRPAGAAAWMQRVSLCAVLVVVAVRPLVSESYDSAASAITRAVEELADPSPVRTLAFDLGILVAAAMWLLSYAINIRIRYRRTGLEFGLAVLILGGVVSCLFAGNKRLAINATLDWLCLPILTLTLVQLLLARWQRRLAIAVILASAAVNAAQSYEQYFVGFQETIEQYEARKVEFWQQQGVDLDSTTVEAFERRLHAREASGFFAHSNVAGAYLVLCVFAGLALLQFGGVMTFLQGVFVALIASAVFLTGSLGALAGGALGICLLVIGHWNWAWLDHHRRRLFCLGWLAAIAVLAAVVGHGLYHDSLPGWSLTFRWQYWKATIEMIADHFWTGVGRENFGRHYTAYKAITSPEEVTNPHNFLLQAFAEYGVLGFLGFVLMLVGVTWRAARLTPLVRSGEGPESNGAGLRVLILGAGVGLTVVVLRCLLLGTSDPSYVYYSAVFAAIIWFPAFLLMASSHSPSSPSMALAVGLLTSLAQDMISFALFVPAAATTFFALVAVWLSTFEHNSATPVEKRSQSRNLAAVAAGLFVGAFAVVFLVPVARTRTALKDAERFVASGNLAEADRAYARAQQADPLDPTPWVEHARALAGRMSAESLTRALDALAEARRRDPHLISIPRNESFVHSALATITGDEAHYRAAIESARAALALYPQDPHGLVRLAETEAVAGKDLQSTAMLESAVAHYQQALALDEQRLEWETIQRFRPAAVDEINAKIRGIQVLLNR